MTALNYLQRVPLDVTPQRIASDGDDRVVIRLHNPTSFVAFFERGEILLGARRG